MVFIYIKYKYFNKDNVNNIHTIHQDNLILNHQYYYYQDFYIYLKKKK